MVAFGGTRTYHRLACAIEDAGFEVRDSLHWMYGSGFPKGLDVSKAIDKAAGAQREVTGPPTRHGGGTNGVYAQDAWTQANQATMGAVTAPATEDAARWQGWNVALKPAHEPIILARKPLSEGTVAANVLHWGTGALNVDGCRVEGVKDVPASPRRAEQGPAYGELGNDPGTGSGWDPNTGRWPPNLLLTHSADCRQAGTRRVKVVGATAHQAHHAVEGIAHGATPHEHPGYRDQDGTETVQAFTCAPGCPVAGLDAQSGNVRSSGKYVKGTHGIDPAGGTRGAAPFGNDGSTAPTYGDAGGASRFFPAFTWSPEYDLPFMYQAKAPKKERPVVEGLPGHPTVKPLELMRWLVRLITPPGGLILDPFAGTGTTIQAALLEGFRVIGIDDDGDSIARIRVRLADYEVKYA